MVVDLTGLTSRVVSIKNKKFSREVNPQQLIEINKLLSEPLEKTYYYLNTSEEGLSSENAEALLDIYGYNELIGKKKKNKHPPISSPF